MILTDETIAGQFDRLPPCSIESEMCMLGSMMLDKEAIGIVLAIVGRVAIYQADHQIIFDVLVKLYEQNRPIDVVIVREELVKRGLLQEIGGASYLGQIISSVPSSGHVAHYANVVRETHLLRQYIEYANKILRDAYGSHEQSADEMGQGIATRLASIVSANKGSTGHKLIDVAQEVYEQMEREQTERIFLGVKTLDDAGLSVGLGETVILAARPSMGKSLLAKQIAVEVALKHPVILVSTEERRDKIARNVFANLANIDNHRIRDGRKSLTEADWRALAGSLADIARRNLIIVDDAFHIRRICTLVPALVAKHKARMVIIDHMHRIRSDDKSPYERITSISLALSTLMKETQVAGIVLAQLNREAPKREDKRPTITDLRESGSIEQDADAILFLHREDYYHLDDRDYIATREAEVIVAKFRDGIRGNVFKLRSNLAMQRFEDIEQEGF
jgi:replicative DNA helicase